MDARSIEELKGMVEHCRRNPSVLHTPPLAFFKHFLLSLGAQVPVFGKSGRAEEDDDQLKKKQDKLGFGVSNGDTLELDSSDVVEPDNDPPQKMGDPSIRITEENQEAAQCSRAKAMDAVANGKFQDATEHLTEAIMLNPKSAILYADRASVFVKLKKPNAAIRDADAALQINLDSAKGYKARGMARAMLGLWEEAATDLHMASKLDFDDEIDLMLKKVETNTEKIKEHRQKYERRRKGKELKKIEPKRQMHENSEAASIYKYGEVIEIRSASVLKDKLDFISKIPCLAVIYFTAKWCGPCRYISPVITDLAGEFSKVMFLKLDIEQVMEVAAEWKIAAIPSFFFLRNGKEIDRVISTDISMIGNKVSQHARQFFHCTAD
ncbi:TPR repeat-containing thioredoxin TDX-like [Andrographis paniculata]|uniref:TPR repeat-containing thioredoxin TDX-like n=1 Tax=Andrographis paniculata TaxID=175694 RepID=UPI0021E90B11|nr:TPR repeat-containing thioredoxin TDX-like [Andrographis paniculata]